MLINIWDGPCNKRELALIATLHADQLKCLFYKEKSRLEATLSWMAGALVQYTDSLIRFDFFLFDFPKLTFIKINYLFLFFLKF